MASSSRFDDLVSESVRLQLELQFIEASNAGDLEKVKKLVKELDDEGDGLAKTVADARGPEGLNALHFAALGGRTQLCKYLIKKLEVDVNAKDKKGRTPLHHAIKGGHHSAAVYLLENGANPNAACDEGQTALHYVAESGLKKLLLLLVSKGAEVNAISESGTPLHKAARNGKKEVVEVLLDNHANPNITLPDAYSPLCSSILAQSFECVKLLVQAGADLNLSSKGMTPLHGAVSEGKNEIVKYLLGAGADPNVDNDGLTPLEAAAIKRNYAAVDLLFPLTSPVLRVPEWTVDGIISHYDAVAAENERILKELEFLSFREKGNDALVRKEHLEAMRMYTKALERKPDAGVYSTRSYCWTNMGSGKLALSDAESCVKLSPDLPDGYYAMGKAYSLLNDHSRAADSFGKALELEPDRKLHQEGYWEAIELEFEQMLTLRDCLQFTTPPSPHAGQS